jgi:ketosteroid isomerase-like protein
MTLSTADRLEILDVISRADWAASRRDAAAYADLFTDDVVLDGAQGRHAGQDALRASVGPIWAAEGPASLHLTLNPIIEAGETTDGHAVTRSILLIIDPVPRPTIRTAAVITQTLRRTGGSWRISRRTVATAPDGL